MLNIWCCAFRIICIGWNNIHNEPWNWCILFILHAASTIKPTWSHGMAYSLSVCFFQGAVPFLVSCTSGTTVQGAFDPLDRIADVCEEHKLWMHVDVSHSCGRQNPCLLTSLGFMKLLLNLFKCCLFCHVFSGCLGRECALFQATQTSDERGWQVLIYLPEICIFPYWEGNIFAVHESM